MSESKNVLKATDQNFDSDIVQSNQLSLVDFWAEWCGPCHMLSPTIDALADEYEGKLKVYKMNVDENPNVPGQFQIRGIPTVILFKGGKPVDQLVGLQSKESLSEAINKHLS